MISIGTLTMNSMDYVFIVDKNYTIVYDTRFDETMNNSSNEYLSSDVMGKNFFEAFPEFSTKDSSIVECMKTGKTVVAKNQRFKDFKNREYFTSSVTVPLMRKGVMIGVVELSMDAGDKKNLDNTRSSQLLDTLVDRLQQDVEKITFKSILTEDRDMMNTVEKAKMLATAPMPTLIYGETGTGKEVFAQAMMTYSGIPVNKHIIQNCAAVPENLIESILFGTAKGAYTGAENTIGLFERADGGVLFLDELNAIPYTVQAKLLRVLQDGTFRPLGSVSNKAVKVKVIAAMNIDPQRAMSEKIIRKDLFYRFSGGLLNIKPLRKRPEDIELFTSHYISFFSQMYGKNIRGITKDLKQKFRAYDWEGNVRELRNAVESMVNCAEDNSLLSFEDLPDYLQQKMQNVCRAKEREEIFETKEENLDVDYKQIIKQTERKLIETALKKAEGNRTEAARILKLPRQTLNYKIKILDIK